MVEALQNSSNCQSSIEDTLFMKVQLKLSARELTQQIIDITMPSAKNVQCTIYEKKNSQWAQTGQTEQLNDTKNPDFASALTVRYYFEKVQNFKFEIKDIDTNGRFEMIGSLEVTMGTLMGSPGQVFKGDLCHNGY